jgi:hypothetical protein
MLLQGGAFGTSGDTDCFGSRGGRGCGLQAAHPGCVPRTSPALCLRGGGSAPSPPWYCGGGSLHLERQRRLWGGAPLQAALIRALEGPLLVPTTRAVGGPHLHLQRSHQRQVFCDCSKK